MQPSKQGESGRRKREVSPLSPQPDASVVDSRQNGVGQRIGHFEEISAGSCDADIACVRCSQVEAAPTVAFPCSRFAGQSKLQGIGRQRNAVGRGAADRQREILIGIIAAVSHFHGQLAVSKRIGNFRLEEQRVLA